MSGTGRRQELRHSTRTDSSILNQDTKVKSGSEDGEQPIPNMVATSPVYTTIPQDHWVQGKTATGLGMEGASRGPVRGLG
jgi:hypothetical protein